MAILTDNHDRSEAPNHSDRHSFSTWLKPVSNQSSYGSLWSAVQELQSIHLNRFLSLSPAHPESDGAVDQIDPWERTFVIHWLTRLLSFTIDRMSTARDQHDWESLSSFVGQVMAQMTESPATSSQSFLRRYTFDLSQEFHDQSLKDSVEIEVNEGSLSYSAIGFQTWNSAPLLCRRLVRDPFEFFPQLLPESRDPCDPTENSKPSRRSLKVLELGSGTGLVGLTASHVVSSILAWLDSLLSIDVEIILTDYHPEVLDNLRSNLELNKLRLTLPKNCSSTLKVEVMKLDWRELKSSALVAAGLTGAFDVILGSDLVYEPEHAIWAANAVRYFLKPKPNELEPSDGSNSEDSDQTLITSPADGMIDETEPQPKFHLLLPLRPTFIKESEAVHGAFGGSDLSLLLDRTDHLVDRFPIHSCEWELSSTPKAEQISPVLNTKSLKIVQYAKEEGVKFGQGCGEYQYLQIQWVD